MRRATALATGAAIVLAVASGCSNQTSRGAAGGSALTPLTSPTSTVAVSASGSAPGGSDPSRPTWLMTRQVVAELTAADPSVRTVLDAGSLDELLTPGQPAVADIPARQIVTFASAAALDSAVAAGQLPAGTAGVLYDPEAWSFTPEGEQRDPVAAAARAASIAHAHGLQFIVAPALDLTSVLGAGARGSRENRFLRLGLLRQLAASADVIELQAQSLERSTGQYRRFVLRAAMQTQTAGHRVQLLAGLSTNPPGAPVELTRLRLDIAATRPTVDGYWLNIPGQGAKCPTCNPARPQLGAQLILSP